MARTSLLSDDLIVKGKSLNDLSPKEFQTATEGTQTYLFSIDGKAYEVDLNPENADRLREAVAEFVAVATPVAGNGRGTRAVSSPSSSTGPSRAEGRAARAWAQGDGKATVEAEGVKIPGDRGRVDARIVSLWEDAGKPGL